MQFEVAEMFNFALSNAKKFENALAELMDTDPLQFDNNN